MRAEEIGRVCVCVGEGQVEAGNGTRLASFWFEVLARC